MRPALPPFSILPADATPMHSASTRAQRRFRAAASMDCHREGGASQIPFVERTLFAPTAAIFKFPPHLLTGRSGGERRNRRIATADRRASVWQTAHSTGRLRNDDDRCRARTRPFPVGKLGEGTRCDAHKDWKDKRGQRTWPLVAGAPCQCREWRGLFPRQARDRERSRAASPRPAPQARERWKRKERTIFAGWITRATSPAFSGCSPATAGPNREGIRKLRK